MEFDLPSFVGKSKRNNEEEDRDQSPPKSQKLEEKQERGTSSQHSSTRANGPRTLGSSSQDGFQQLVMATAELSMEAAANSRDALSMMEWSVLAPADTPSVVAGLAEGRVYDQEKKQKKGQNIGGSHVRICLATLAALTKTKEFQEEEAAELKKAMTEFWSNFVQKFNKEQLEEFIHTFRVQKPKNPSQQMTESFGSYAKIVFRMKPMTPTCQTPAALEEQLVAHFRRMGWRVMLGPPPRSGKERKVIEALKNISRR